MTSQTSAAAFDVAVAASNPSHHVISGLSFAAHVKALPQI